MDVKTLRHLRSPVSTFHFSFLAGDHFTSLGYHMVAKLLLSSLCRCRCTSLASFYPSSLKSSPPFSVLLFVARTSCSRFYFSSPFRYRYFHDSFYAFFLQQLAFLSTVVQAMLLRNPLSFL